MKEIYIFVFLMVLGIGDIHAQLLPMLSQYRSGSFLLNPAIPATADLITNRTGTFNNLTYRQSFGIAYRSQWWAIGADRPQTFSAHFQRYISLGKGKNLWAGGYFLADKSGLLNQTSGYVSTSLHIQLNQRNHLFAGLTGGFIQNRLRTDDLVADNIFDPLIIDNGYTSSGFDFGGGLYFVNDIFYAGVSMPRIGFSVKELSLQEKARGGHVYGLAGAVIRKSAVFETIEPQIWIRQAIHSPIHMDLSCRFQPITPLKVPLWFGIGIDNTVAMRYEAGTLIRSGWKYSYPDIRIGFMYSNRVTYAQGLGGALELTISALMR